MESFRSTCREPVRIWLGSLLCETEAGPTTEKSPALKSSITTWAERHGIATRTNRPESLYMREIIRKIIGEGQEASLPAPRAVAHSVIAVHKHVRPAAWFREIWCAA